jgi:hypothetical protein
MTSPLDPVLSQTTPVHILILHVFKIHFNIIFQFTPVCFKWFRPYRFSDYNSILIHDISGALFIFPIAFAENTSYATLYHLTFSSSLTHLHVILICVLRIATQNPDIS